MLFDYYLVEFFNTKKRDIKFILLKIKKLICYENTYGYLLGK